MIAFMKRKNLKGISLEVFLLLLFEKIFLKLRNYVLTKFKLRAIIIML